MVVACEVEAEPLKTSSLAPSPVSPESVGRGTWPIGRLMLKSMFASSAEYATVPRRLSCLISRLRAK